MTVHAAIAHSHEYVQRAVGASPRRIVEIGCGGGEIAAALAACGHEIVGVEPDATRAAAAMRRGVAVVLGSWPDREFVDRERGRFDAALFTRSLHHMHDLGGALASAASVLAPGGLLVVEDFAYDAANEDDVHWLLAWVGSLRAAGVLKPGSELMPWAEAGVDAVGEWRANHEHGLHGWETILAAARVRFTGVRWEATPYLFRYLCEMLTESRADAETMSRVCAAALVAEDRRAQQTGRLPVGRRLIARCAPET